MSVEANVRQGGLMAALTRKSLLGTIAISIFLMAACTEQAANNEEQANPVQSAAVSRDKIALDEEAASAFAKLALKCVAKEYPNKLSHVMNDSSEVLSPFALHPAFYGCFDWHSAVHGHWMLVRLLKLFPALPLDGEIRSALHANLTADNIRTEVEYLDQPNRKSFERTYGWAWLLKLTEELHGWEDADGRQWAENLAPLAEAIADRYIDFLPRQNYPIRTGVHPNTAFGIAFALDYAQTVGNSDLEELLVERSIFYYGEDNDYPAEWEPGGDDFFSPCLMEADLMRRVLPADRFDQWFREFLPQLAAGDMSSILRPALVTDRTDPKIVHLDGLNLSRAWCMAGIIEALPDDGPQRSLLMDSMWLHAQDALAHVASGNYEGEHWLASFAVFTLSAMERLQ
jgi:hypothetical protein